MWMARSSSGAAYLGTRPTFDAGLPLLETFLFDFDGNLYGKTLEIEFIAFVREDAKFRSSRNACRANGGRCGQGEGTPRPRRKRRRKLLKIEEFRVIWAAIPIVAKVPSATVAMQKLA